MNKPNIDVVVSGPKQAESTYKNVVLKGNHNFASQVTKPNCIYTIKWDFDLGGEEVTIPENCVLKFEGGSLRNGKVISNHTIIIDYYGNSNALYGLFYDKNGNVLNYCYKEPSDFKITECYTFVDDMVTIEPAEYQSIVRYKDYLFIIGYPWEKADVQSPGAYQLYIHVFNVDNYSHIGTAYTNVQAHANGATIKDKTLYVCPACGNKYNSGAHEGEFIFPYRKCLSAFNCEDVVNAAIEGKLSPISDTKINLEYLEEYLVAADGVTTLDWVMGIDYDSIHKEFALDVNGIILFLDDDFGYLRKSVNYKTATYDQYMFNVGCQDLVYKNGIVYCHFNSFDNSPSSRRGTLVNHPVALTIDSLSGKVIECNDIETPYHYCEHQGAFKDVDDEQTWSLFVCRKGDSVYPSQVHIYTIIKIAPKILSSKYTNSILKTDSNRKRLLDNGTYLEVFVDSTTENTIQNGTYDYPFRTLEQAVHTVMTVSDNIVFRCRNGNGQDDGHRYYKAQLSAVVGKTFRLQSYTGSGDDASDYPIIDINGKFYNCYISFRWLRIKPTLFFSSLGNSCINLNNSLFMLRDSTVTIHNDDIINSNGFLSSTNSKLSFINCSFKGTGAGAKYIINSLRGVCGTFDSCSFDTNDTITNLIYARDDWDIDINIQNHDISVYNGIDKLTNIQKADDNTVVYLTKPFVNFCGYTANNMLTAMCAAKKNGVANIIGYNQLSEGAVQESDVLSSVKSMVSNEYEDDLDYNGYYHRGLYVFKDSRFEDSFDHVLGCALRGTTAQRPTAKYPYMVKTGVSYFDTTIRKPLFWGGLNWIECKVKEFIDIPSSSNLNDYNEPGVYGTASGTVTSTLQNIPQGLTGSFTMSVFNAATPANNSIKGQIIIGNNNLGIFIRFGAETWYAWKSLLYSQSSKRKGTTSQRPTLDDYNVGFCYVDTTLNKPVFYAGSGTWVDATGTAV